MSAPKKAKIEGDPLRIAHWCSQKDDVRAQFNESGPFRHLTLPNFLDDKWARTLLQEMLENLHMTYKETDLFKFHQSKDIGVDTKLPIIEEFKRQLYSPKFVEFLEDVLGLERGLICMDHADLASQCYSKGHHLLCHDDVIGTRVISFVIYLNSPNEPWTEDEGGAFELYGSKDGHVMSEPSKKILPNFNHATIFLVEPTKSYHAVEEIFGDRTRVSLQGWFHAKDITKTVRYNERHLCTVQDYLRKGPSPDSTPLKMDNYELTEADINYLKEWISAEYFCTKSQKDVCAYFEDASEVLLQDFFLADKLCDACDEDIGFDLVGPPHVRKYLLRNESEATLEGTKRLDALKQMLVSPAFAKLLKLFTNLRVSGLCSTAIRRFRPKHYSVATTGGITESKAELDVTWCQVAASDAWETEEIGGFESYMEADEDDDIETQEIYRDTEQGPLINIIPRPNALSIVMRDRHTMKFVKYLSSAAPSSRTDIAISFAIHEGDLPETDNEEEASETADEGEEEEEEA
eukprot:GEMP01031813.1.p1 GENE.GEMP01031813.1~~GEMP01031813.1.p1  ORF type:complete len:519 (+),score=122.99 GEMP01031813.1:27-1583(+)